MYFVKYQPLKQRLQARLISDREALPYLIIFAGLTALVGSLPIMDGYNFWDGISASLSVIATVGGVLYAYYKNGGANGFDLIQKYVILGWVVFVRVFIVLIPTVFALIIIEVVTGLISSDATGPFDVAIIFIAEVILYQRIGRHIGDTVASNS